MCSSILSSCCAVSQSACSRLTCIVVCTGEAWAVLLQGMPEFDKRSNDDRADGTHQPLCVHQVIWEEDVFDVGYACSPVTQGVMANVLDSTTWRAALQGAHDVVLQAPACPGTLIALARHSSALQACVPTMCRWTV
jgi:hypothetical protein